MRPGEDVVVGVVPEGGEAKAVWMASAALARAHSDYRAFSVEIEDLGTDFETDPTEVLAWDEIS